MPAEVETIGARERDLPMGGHDRDAAIGPVRGDHGSDPGGRVGVEGDRRLVEQPERGGRGREAREREAPPLPGREEARRHVGERVDAERRQCAGRGPGGTPEVRPAVQILGCRQRRLHRIEMADIVGSAAMGGPVLVHRRAVPGERAACRPEQPGQNPQQAGLAGAVGSDEGEGAPPLETKRDPGEDRALAADAGQVVRLEAGRVGRAVCRAGNLAPLSGRA